MNVCFLGKTIFCTAYRAGSVNFFT